MQKDEPAPSSVPARRGIAPPRNQPKKIGEKARRAIATVLFLTKTTKQNGEGMNRQTSLKDTVVPIVENVAVLGTSSSP
jgi:hypothetical protein